MVGRDRAGIRRKRSLSPFVALVALGATTVAFAAPSGAQGSGEGSGAFGYSATVSLFGGAQPPAGPAPTVTLPAAGSAAPVTATAPSARVVYGPATIFSSGPLEVSTQGTPDGTVTSSSKITSVNTSQQEVFTAGSVTSTCTASADGANGSATISGGKLTTAENNPDDDGDDTVVDVPANPGPNTRIEGKIEGVGDTFRYTFNEQVRNGDGSITVTAAHQELLGPTAVGHLYIGQSRCVRGAGGGGGAGSGRSATTVAAGSGRQGSSATTVPTRGVADTGTDVLPLLLPAAALIAAGTTAVVVSRRRRVRAGDPGGS